MKVKLDHATVIDRWLREQVPDRSPNDIIEEYFRETGHSYARGSEKNQRPGRQARQQRQAIAANWTKFLVWFERRQQASKLIDSIRHLG